MNALIKVFFPSILENANITPVFKSRFIGSKDNTDLLVYFQLSVKYLRNYNENKFLFEY